MNFVIKCNEVAHGLSGFRRITAGNFQMALFVDILSNEVGERIHRIP